MPLNLDNIGTIKFPKSKTLLECENGAFTISENGIIRFTYDRKPDLEQIRTAEEELETENRTLTEMLEPTSECTEFDLRQQRATIRRLESKLEFLRQERVQAQYECWGIETEDILRKWLELAKSSNKNNVRSVAYKTGLRFEDTENPSIDIDYIDNEIGDGIISYREWHYTGKKTERTAE